MSNLPLPYAPAAIATSKGWAHETTGEQLVSMKGLEAVEGTETYVPSSPVWMAAHNAEPAPT